MAIIERGKFGGTCVNNGCIPTKTLVASAYAAHLARRAGEYGVDTGAGAGRHEARQGAQGRDLGPLQSGRRALDARQPDHARSIRATHASSGRIASRSDDEVLHGDRIFINVGGRPLVPAMPGLDRVPFLTNVSMMDVDFLPEHLIVIGGSYIGLEFGQMYRRFGSRVTIVEMGAAPDRARGRGRLAGRAGDP